MNDFNSQIVYWTVHPGALQVTATSGNSVSVLGQSYSMNCIGHKMASGLINLPSPQWLTFEGNTLSSDAQLQGPRNVGLSSSEIVATFPILHTSHAGNYTCRVSLSSPALSTPIIKTAFFRLTVQSKSLSHPQSHPKNHLIYTSTTISFQPFFNCALGTHYTLSAS